MSLARIRFVVHFADGEVIEGRPFVGAYCSPRRICLRHDNTPLPFLSPLERGEKGVCNTPPAPLDRVGAVREPPLLETGWRDLPDKPIVRLSLVNPHGDLITLQGYEEYNFMVESLQALGMASYVSDVYLMGARDGKVTVYRVGAGLAPAQNVRAGVKPAPTNPLQVGDIAVRVIDRGKEYLGAETTGWKSASGGMEGRNVENPPSLRLRSGQAFGRGA